MSGPPYYILVAHSSLQHNSAAQSNALIHADIEYRYADDPPLSLLPRFADEHVLVFNYDPSSATKPTISSTSSQLALSGIKVLPAPGARADEDSSKNDNMYIIEVASTSDDQYAIHSMVLGFLLNCSTGLAAVWNHPKHTYRILRLFSPDSNKGVCKDSHSLALAHRYTGTLTFVTFWSTQTLVQALRASSPAQLPFLTMV
ncbi:hypothetical protein J3R82DRAFT_962 [Butyriboletus roseoflavus]|nr:hypothetical protein J3R82DRAFT_962 [Butyriboletus roseoflavus]